MEDALKLSGRLAIVLKDKNDTVKDYREVTNLVVNSGLAYFISRAVSADKMVMTHVGIGSSDAATSATQTALQGALGSRKGLTSTTITGTHSEKVQYVASFAAGEGTGAVTEAGIFNNSTAGDMLARVVFPVINKGADDTLSITWTITLSAV